MNINAANNGLTAGQMIINGRNVAGADSAGGTLNIGGGAKAAGSGSQNKPTSLFENFTKEMSKRLTASMKLTDEKNEEAQAKVSLLTQSLAGAMGQVEDHLGKEAATEVMAKILTGTADGISEESLLNSIKNGLAGLTRFDPNGVKVKQLTDAFNKDLTLAFDPDKAEEKIKAGETLSLSYAISSHFGSLTTPQAKPDDTADASGPDPYGEEVYAGSTEDPAVISGQAATDGSLVPDSAEAAANLNGAASSLFSAGSADGKTTDYKKPAEMYEMMGFDETGAWGTVEVAKPDEMTDQAMKEAAEAGISKARELDLATLIDKGGAQHAFNEMALFLKEDLQDKEAYNFVSQCVGDALSAINNKYGNSAKMSEMLSQVYSKIADEGDAEKLAGFETYINTTFKEYINPVLSDIQEKMPHIIPGGEVGQIQFKGIIGVSSGQESDAFGFKWGYKDDDTFDYTDTRKYLQEDILAVKQFEQKEYDQKTEILKAHEAKKADENEAKMRETLSKTDLTEEEIQDRLLFRQPHEEAEAERQDKLTEAMTMKFGQLDDNSRQKLEQYINSNFDEEQANELLSDIAWNKDIMQGLAGMHRDIRELNGEAAASGFLSFINSDLKQEVQKLTDKLGGMEFEGWSDLGGVGAELEATFRFAGQDEATRVSILAPEKMLNEQDGENLDQLANAENILKAGQTAQETRDESNIPLHKRTQIGTGYLINVTT